MPGVDAFDHDRRLHPVLPIDGDPGARGVAQHGELGGRCGGRRRRGVGAARRAVGVGKAPEVQSTPGSAAISAKTIRAKAIAPAIAEGRVLSGSSKSPLGPIVRRWGAAHRCHLQLEVSSVKSELKSERKAQKGRAWNVRPGSRDYTAAGAETICLPALGCLILHRGVPTGTTPIWRGDERETDQLGLPVPWRG